MSRRSPFSLVELSMQLVTVVALAAMFGIVGLQSSMAVDFVSEVRSRQHLQAVRGQLSQAAERQVEHLLATEAFATSPADLEVVPVDGVVMSMTASATGWTAVASHPALGDDAGCAVFLGDPPATLPVRPARPGQVACTQ